MDGKMKISVLEVYDIKKAERKVLHEFAGVIEAPNWLRDGDTLLYNANGRIWKYSIASGKTEQLDTGRCNNCNNDHVPSPGNEELYISCAPQGETGWVSQIFVLPIKGGNPRLVVENSPSYLHGCSNDGKELAYCAFRENIVDIYSILIDGGIEKRLTDGVGYNDGPEYSPDDRHIWFNSSRTGLMQIFRMNRDGSNLTQITDTESNNWFPHVSPDGKKVVYLSFQKDDLEAWQHVPDKHVKMWLMDYDGSNPQCIVSLFGGQDTINVNSWAPDSSRFAFVSYRYE